MSTETLSRFPGRRLRREHQQGGPPFVDPRPTWKIWLESITGTDKPQFPPESLDAFISLHRLMLNPEAALDTCTLPSYTEASFNYLMKGYLANLQADTQTFGSVPFFRGAFNVEFVVPSVSIHELAPMPPTGRNLFEDHKYIYPITSYMSVFQPDRNAIQVYAPQQRLVRDYMYRDFHDLAQYGLQNPTTSYLESYLAEQ